VPKVSSSRPLSGCIALQRPLLQSESQNKPQENNPSTMSAKEGGPHKCILILLALLTLQKPRMGQVQGVKGAAVRRRRTPNP